MAELVHERTLKLVDREGTVYDRALVYAEPQTGGTWAAWVEFLPHRGEKVVQTDRETTQSTLQGVAYWAEGLQPTYFDGALERAVRRSSNGRTRPTPSPLGGGGQVKFCLRSLDPETPFRVMAKRTLVPGARRTILDGGVITYFRSRPPLFREMPFVYEFVAQFQSANAARILAERLCADLAGTDATLEVEKDEVPLESEPIRDALLACLSRDAR
jgi:hypothetical protein